MAKNAAPLLLGGAALLLLATGGKKKGRATKGISESDSPKMVEDGAGGVVEEEEPPEDAEMSYDDLVKNWEGPNGVAALGRFYQVRQGDTILDVAREALFGSREPRVEAWERQAVIDLSIRIDCGPFNQSTNGRRKDLLKPGHYAVENGWSQKGVAFLPIFPDNRARLSQGKPPSGGNGNSFPYIWVPAINPQEWSEEGQVTTFGMNWDDDGNGGYSMIDPPPWVIDLGFDEDVEEGEVGCNLPEGDFRRMIESAGE